MDRCPFAASFPLDDCGIMELRPGTNLVQNLGLRLVWVANASAPGLNYSVLCGGLAVDAPGTYVVTAVFASGTLYEQTTLPVWRGSLVAPTVSFVAS